MAEAMNPETGEIVTLVHPVGFTNAQLDLIKRTIMPGKSTTDEFELFIYQCKRTGLDPMTRQIYAMRNNDGRLSIQISVDGFRLIAERSGKYAGQVGPFWCGKDGVWHDVWVDGNPAAAKVGILRSDFKEPCWGVARFDSYANLKSGTWRKMPDLMIAKVAETLAIRRAFPQELSGIYSEEEMEQAQVTEVTAPTIEPAPAPKQAKPTLASVTDSPEKQQARDLCKKLIKDIGDAMTEEDLDAAGCEERCNEVDAAVQASAGHEAAQKMMRDIDTRIAARRNTIRRLRQGQEDMGL